MLTARAEPEQRIEGLETGVDDYLAKPFEPRELLLRVQQHPARAGARRRRPRDESRMGDFVFHSGAASSSAASETVRLTERERDLLRYFAQRPGMPVSRHELAKDDDATGGERAIDVQINRLRRKIENDPANPGLSADRARQGLHSVPRVMERARRSPTPKSSLPRLAARSTGAARGAIGDHDAEGSLCPRADHHHRADGAARNRCSPSCSSSGTGRR